MYHESPRCISILFYTNEYDKIKNNCVILENISFTCLLLKQSLIVNVTIWFM